MRPLPSSEDDPKSRAFDSPCDRLDPSNGRSSVKASCVAVPHVYTGGTDWKVSWTGKDKNPQSCLKSAMRSFHHTHSVIPGVIRQMGIMLLCGTAAMCVFLFAITYTDAKKLILVATARITALTLRCLWLEARASG